MHFRLVSKVLSLLAAIVSLSMTWPLIWALSDGSGDRQPFLLSIGLGLLLSGLLYLGGRKADYDDLGIKDGFAVVTLSWVIASVVGALPYYLYGTVPTFTDAFFEAISGFTTTGASVITAIEANPPTEPRKERKMRRKPGQLAQDAGQRAVWAALRLPRKPAQRLMNLIDNHARSGLPRFQLGNDRRSMVFDQTIERPVKLRSQLEIVRGLIKLLKPEVGGLLELPRFTERLYVCPGHWKTAFMFLTTSGLLHVSGRKLETNPCLSKLISSPTRSSGLRTTVIASRYGVSVADTIFQPIPSRRARAQRSNASASGEYPFVARHSKAKSERNGQCSESLACMAVTTFFPL